MTPHFLKRVKYRHILPDMVLVIASLYASLFLRVGWEGFSYYSSILNRYLPLFVLLRIGTFLAMGIYDIVWRYVSLKDVIKLVKAVALSSLMIVSASYLVNVGHLPRAIFYIDCILLPILLVGIRTARRILFSPLHSDFWRRRGIAL